MGKLQCFGDSCIGGGDSACLWPTIDALAAMGAISFLRNANVIYLYDNVVVLLLKLQLVKPIRSPLDMLIFPNLAGP